MVNIICLTLEKSWLAYLHKEHYHITPLSPPLAANSAKGSICDCNIYQKTIPRDVLGAMLVIGDTLVDKVVQYFQLHTADPLLHVAHREQLTKSTVHRHVCMHNIHTESLTTVVMFNTYHTVFTKKHIHIATTQIQCFPE